MNKKVKKFTIISVFIALALVLSYVDSLIHISVAVPGIKLGIANIAIIYALYKIGVKEAILISLLRIILSSILFGNVVSMAYSLAGAALSLSLMILLKKIFNFSIITVSIVGAIMHNIGQIIMAIILLSAAEIIYHLPVLLVTGTISGIGVGILSALVLKYTKNITTL